MVRLEKILNISLQDVLKMSWRRIEDPLKTSSKLFENVLKTPWRGLEDVLNTSWIRLENIQPTRIYWYWPRRLQNVFKTSWRFLGKTSWRRLEDVLKTSCRRLGDIWPRRIIGLDQDVLKTLWRGLEDVLKTSWRRLDIWPKRIYWSWPRRLLKSYGYSKHIRLNQDVFWRRRWKASSRRLHQDECLLG